MTARYVKLDRFYCWRCLHHCGARPFGLKIIAVISLFEAYALFHSELIIQNYKNHVIRVTLQRL